MDQKINKQTLELNDTVDQIDQTDIYRVFHPAIGQYPLFSAAHGIFSKIDNILGHKTNLNKYKKTEITPCILSDHNPIKQELNNKRNSRKYSDIWKLNITLLLDQCVIEEIREEITKLLEFDENESTNYQNLWDTAKAVLRGKFMAMDAYIKNTERFQINDLTLHFKLLKK
jgi:hypothetical protein